MQLSHRELYDTWLQTQPSDRRRQDSKPADQGRESVDVEAEDAEGTAMEDDGEIADDDVEEGDADVEERDTGSGRRTSRNAFGFADTDFLMDVDPVSNPPLFLSTMNDTRADQNQLAILHTTRLQHQGLDLELPRQESRSQAQPYIQPNAARNSDSHPNDSFHRQSISNARPTQPQTSVEMSNTGLPLNLPRGQDRTGDSYNYRQERHRHPVDDAFARGTSPPAYRQAIPSQQRSRSGLDSRSDPFAPPVHAPPANHTYATIAETTPTMGGARDNEEMLSRLDILLAAAAQPEHRGRSNQSSQADDVGVGQEWRMDVPNNTLEGALSLTNDPSLSSGLQRKLAL